MHPLLPATMALILTTPAVAQVSPASTPEVFLAEQGIALAHQACGLKNIVAEEILNGDERLVTPAAAIDAISTHQLHG